MKSKIWAAVALVVVIFALVIAIHLVDKQEKPAPGHMGPNSKIASSTAGAPVSGLVAAYSLNEGLGTTAADASGNANTGTIMNAEWTKGGKFGNALVFNGHDALVTIAHAASLHLTSGMTLEAWVNPSAIPPANCIPRSTCYRMDVIHKDSGRCYRNQFEPKR